MANNVAKNNPIDLRLPITPETDNPELLPELSVIYVALHALHQALADFMFGLGQTPQDMTASRAFGVQYKTGNKGRYVHISCTGSTGTYLTATIGGVAGWDGDEAPNTNHRMQCVFFVPPNTTYQVDIGTGTPVILKWNEVKE